MVNPVRTILRVYTLSGGWEGNVDTFDDPEKLAMASEGFCPYILHDGQHKINPVTPNQDGTVTCASGIVMRYEWDTEEIPEIHDY